MPRQQATVILTMDRSGSMTATDVQPDRMTAAREAAASFAEGLPDGFKVGVVSFSDKADVVVPPTADRQEAVDALSQIQAENGTAIGDAIARSLDLGLSSLDKDKLTADGKVEADANGQSPLVILLLSDGASTTGDYTPLEAAQMAKDTERAHLHGRARHRERHDPGPRRLRRRPHDPRPAGSRDARSRSPR